MIAPFSRRDTVTYALMAGATVGALTLAGFLTGIKLEWRGLGWAVAAAALAMLVPLVIGSRLPPDLPLLPLSEGGARQALGPPLPGIARLRVAVRREPLGRYRIDLHLDGVRIGQARSGAVVVLPIPLGGHALTMTVWMRRLGTPELMNALPGTDTDLVIHRSGGKATTYSVKRDSVAAAAKADRRIAVFGPSEPGHHPASS